MGPQLDGACAWNGLSAAFARLDAGIGWVLKGACAALVVTEVVLLLAGVISRYVFQRPLAWSDELSGVLFLWLAMLGAVLALRGQEHMRMTWLVSKATLPVRRLLGGFGVVLVFAFILLTVLPALDYLEDERIVTLSSLDVSMGWRVAAMPVGLVLMGVSMLLRLRRWPDMAELAATFLVLALCIGTVLPAEPLRNLGRGNLALFFLGRGRRAGVRGRADRLWVRHGHNGLPRHLHPCPDAGALLERTDIARLNAEVRADLERRGMVFNDAKPDSFRERLTAAGFYKEWRGKLGNEAWTLLEKHVGTLA